MATSWAQLVPAIATQITSQQSGSMVAPVFYDMAPLNQALPYIIITLVSESEEQIFDDDDEPTETLFDIAIYSDKIGSSPWTMHQGYVDETQSAVRRWTPTMTNWTGTPIRYDDKRYQILEDSIQTVLTFSTMTNRK